MKPIIPYRSILDSAALPIADIASIARKESVRPRAVYQSHKWFARRLAVTARALLVAAATPADGDFWQAYYQGPSLEGLHILDPFLGGGVMVLEASRLGANVHGVDVEPVATAVSAFQGRLRDLPSLDDHLKRLTDEVGARLQRYYCARDEDGAEETLLHAFWVQKVSCAACSQPFHAHPSFRIARDETIGRQWVACRACSRVLDVDADAKRVTCRCRARTLVDDGHVHNGTARCPACGHEERLIDLALRTGRLSSFHLFAVETIPAGPEVRWPNRLRRIRTATDYDRGRHVAAQRKLSQLLREYPDALPRSPIPIQGRADQRLLQYGYQSYVDLFLPRQKLHLALLGRAIHAMQGPVRDAFCIAFSDHLTTNNVLCAYAAEWRRLCPLFSIRAYRHIARPVEINPWLTKNGRGTFPNAVRAVCRAAESLRRPTEPTLDGLLSTVSDKPSGSWDIHCGDARHLSHLKSGSIDLVLTDPPYFDYISYSELGHFFVPWMARFGFVDPKHIECFPDGQLASEARGATAVVKFTEGMHEALAEIRRVCHPNARVVFTYQNLDGRGWRAIAHAMAGSGILPFQTFPLFGDSSASLHKTVNSISWDAVMVCRVGNPIIGFQINETHRKAGKSAAERWRLKMQDRGYYLSSGDVQNIFHAETVLAAFDDQVLEGYYAVGPGPTSLAAAPDIERPRAPGTML